MNSKRGVRHRCAGRFRSSTAGGRRQSGFTTVEILVGLVAMAALLVATSVWIQKMTALRQNRAAADDIKTVAAAAQRWINANAATVVAAATPTRTYTLSDFSAYLPSSFTQNTNIYGQAYSLRVYQGTPNQLDALVVTTGGHAIPEGDLYNIANMIGGPGGFISNQNATTARGAYSGWNINWSNFGGTPNGGHIAVALFVADASVTNGYLYRNAVAGHPELNAMNTTLNMNGQNVTNANQVTANVVQTGQGNALLLGTNKMYTDSQNTAIRQPGAFYVQNQSGTAFAPINGGDTNVNGNASVTGFVKIAGSGVQGQACSTDAAVVRNSATWSSLLLCSYGRWQPIGTANNAAAPYAGCGPAGSFYTDVNNNGYVCSSNGVMIPMRQMLSNFNTVYKTLVHDTYPWVAKPSCPGGTPVVDIIPQTTGVNVTVGPPYESVVYRMNDGGTYWVPQITLIQAQTGAGESGNDLGLTATAVVQCQYSNGPAPGY